MKRSASACQMRRQCCISYACSNVEGTAMRPALALAEELTSFERPLPVMDNYDLLLADATGGVQ